MKTILGWREWAALPELDVPAIKAKIDTGARTSTLHACNIERVRYQQKDHIKFSIHPLQKRHDVNINCQLALVDERIVINSGGYREKRYVVQTLLQLDERCWPIELTLTNRNDLTFRMLIGRNALCDDFMIDPCASYLLGKKSARRHYRHQRSRLKTVVLNEPSSETAL